MARLLPRLMPGFHADAWEAVFANLEPEERLVAKLVCREWRAVVRRRPAWRRERLRPEWFVRAEWRLALKSGPAGRGLKAVPLRRILPEAAGLCPPVFFRVVGARAANLTPALVADCLAAAVASAGGGGTPPPRADLQSVILWCRRWAPQVSDVSLREAAAAGSLKRVRQALRAGGSLIDWALCAAVEEQHTRVAVLCLKRGGREVPPDSRPGGGPADGAAPRGRGAGRETRAAVAKWISSTSPGRARVEERPRPEERAPGRPRPEEPSPGRRRKRARKRPQVLVDSPAGGAPGKGWTSAGRRCKSSPTCSPRSPSCGAPTGA